MWSFQKTFQEFSPYYKHLPSLWGTGNILTTSVCQWRANTSTLDQQQFSKPTLGKRAFVTRKTVCELCQKAVKWGHLCFQSPANKTDGGEGSSRFVLDLIHFGLLLCLLPMQLHRIKQNEEMGTPRVPKLLENPSRNLWQNKDISFSL